MLLYDTSVHVHTLGHAFAHTHEHIPGLRGSRGMAACTPGGRRTLGQVSVEGGDGAGRFRDFCPDLLGEQ